MSDKNIRTDALSFKDWVLGQGEFSEENLKKARDEFFTKLGKHWSELMLASVEEAFSDHDYDRVAPGYLGEGVSPSHNDKNHHHILTAEEREAVETAIATLDAYRYPTLPAAAATLRKLLERTK